jgi:hypothetical protein
VRTVLLLLFTLVTGSCHSGEPNASHPPARQSAPSGDVQSRLSSEGREAFDLLRKTQRFTDEGIGEDGDTPKEVIAVRILLREPAAKDAFQAVLDSGSIGGQLYAACGLYYTDPPAFERALAKLRNSRARITFQSGCSVLLDHSVADLVELHRRDVVRLEPREQSIRAWKAADPARFGYVYDIAGGGYPNLFKEAGGYCEVRKQALVEGVD